MRDQFEAAFLLECNANAYATELALTFSTAAWVVPLDGLGFEVWTGLSRPRPVSVDQFVRAGEVAGAWPSPEVDESKG